MRRTAPPETMLRTVSPRVTWAKRRKALGVTVRDVMARGTGTGARKRTCPCRMLDLPMAVVSPLLERAPAGERLRSRLLHARPRYLALTKPRIIELLLVTTLPTMFLARRGVPSVALWWRPSWAGRWQPGGPTP